MQLTTRDIEHIITLINLAPVKGADAEQITIIKGKLFSLAKEIETKKNEPAPAPTPEPKTEDKPETEAKPQPEKKGKK